MDYNIANMRYGIIGTGAIGGYYGAKLAHAGQEVHFLLHSDYEYVRQPGLVSHQFYGSINLANYSCRDEVLMQAVVDEFREAGCPMPKLEMLEAELRFLEACHD